MEIWREVSCIPSDSFGHCAINDHAASLSWSSHFTRQSLKFFFNLDCPTYRGVDKSLSRAHTTLTLPFSLEYHHSYLCVLGYLSKAPNSDSAWKKTNLSNSEGSGSTILQFKRSVTLSLVLAQLFVQSSTSAGQIVGIEAKLAKKIVDEFSTRSVLDLINVWLHNRLGGHRPGWAEKARTSNMEQSRARILLQGIVPN